MHVHSLIRGVLKLLMFTGLGLAASIAIAGKVESCTLAASALAFGNYQPAMGSKTSVGTAQMSCTCTGKDATQVSGSTFVALVGTASNATRTIQSGANSVIYGIYTDASFTTVYPSVSGAANFSFAGDCPSGGGGKTVKPLTFLMPATFDVYGRIVDVGSNLNASAGIYSGAFTLTVNY